MVSLGSVLAPQLAWEGGRLPSGLEVQAQKQASLQAEEARWEGGERLGLAGACHQGFRRESKQDPVERMLPRCAVGALARLDGLFIRHPH